MEARSSETAEATEENQEEAQNQQPRATQSQLLLGVGRRNDGEGLWRIFPREEDILDTPSPRATERAFMGEKAFHIQGTTKGKMLFLFIFGCGRSL